MPRRRIIDPEFWQDTLMGSLPLSVRLLYIGTWNCADDAGLLELDATRIKLAVFPRDDRIRVPHVAKWLEQLVEVGRLLEYLVEGRRYALVARFHRHQRVDRPTNSRLPRPPEAVLLRLDPKSRVLVAQRTDAPDVAIARNARDFEATRPISVEPLASPSTHPRRATRDERNLTQGNLNKENARARADLQTGATRYDVGALADEIVSRATPPWSDVLRHVRATTSSSAIATGFRGARLEERADGYAVVVPTTLQEHLVRDRLLGQVREKLGELVGRSVDVRLEVEVAVGNGPSL